jgi:6-phosphofructokinase 1
MQKFRKIGVITSGGDAPGMSTCVKAVVNRAKEMGIELVGAVGGYAGLIKGELISLDNEWVNMGVSKSNLNLFVTAGAACP